MTKRRTLHLGSGVRLVLAALGLAASTFAEAGGPPLPVLKYVGVIPVSWDASLNDAGEQKVTVSKSFPEVVRSSRRFQVLSDDIVKELWGAEEGRKELVSNYELSAFTHLGVARRGDAAAFEMRLMSPKLENYIVETDTVPLSWLQRADTGELQDRLESLVFRVFNRIPVDVSVTSVQGSYVTVSGGEGQGLRPGDELTFLRVTIASQHPANGSWVSFDTSRLGRAKIIEVKRSAAVAEMVEQTYDGAIKIGDGAKVPAIANRRKFARTPDARQDLAPVAKGSVLVAPLPTDPGARAKLAEKPVERPKVVENPSPPAPAAAAAKLEEKKSDSSAAPATPPPANNEGQLEAPAPVEGDKAENEPDLPNSFLAALKEHFSSLSLGFGPRFWSASGSASAGSVLPMYVLNQADVRLSQSITSLIKADYRGNLGFGPTGKGSFFNFGLRGDVYGRWDFKNAIKPIRYLDAGGIIQYQSIGVNGEKFGGYDIISMGALAAVSGRSTVGASDVDWRTHFLFIPQAMGDAGIRGGKKNVSGVFGFEIGAEAVLPAKPGAWEWGAQGYFGSADYSLSAKSLTFTDFYVGALARHRF